MTARATTVICNSEEHTAVHEAHPMVTYKNKKQKKSRGGNSSDLDYKYTDVEIFVALGLTTKTNLFLHILAS